MRPAGYILCATPRTGSTLLCRMLKATGRAGDPDSFISRFIPDWAADWGVPAQDSVAPGEFARAYLAAAIRAGTGGTGLFGLRLMRENVGDLDDMIDLVHPALPAGRARFERLFGPLLYVHLSRRDKLAQAISLVKAQQSGLWHVAPGAEPHYDFARLHREVTELEGFDADWNAWFASQQISPHRIVYEDLATDPAGELARLCAALGIDAPARVDVTPAVAKLSDATSRAWAERYRAEADSNS